MRIRPDASDGADYQIAHPSFMASFIWGATLTVAVVGGSLALSCVAPLCALAVALAATVRLRASLGIMTLVWLANQAIGFTLFHFPRTANSFWWGIAIGVAAWMTAIAAHALMGRTSSWSGPVRLSVALMVTFVLYESVLWLAALILGGRDMFTASIVMQVALINSAWLVGIILLNEIAAAICRPWLGRIPLIVRLRGFG